MAEREDRPAGQPRSAGGILRPDRAGTPEHDSRASLLGPSPGEELVDRLEGSLSSVTAFLERWARESIDADVRSQVIEHPDAPTSLALAPNAAVLRRAVVLHGRASGRAFVYARSAIAVDRLPGSVRFQLEHTKHPIGRILETAGLSPRRVAAGAPRRPWSFPDYPEGRLDDAVLARRYFIAIEEELVFDVSEWFLAAITKPIEGA